MHLSEDELRAERQEVVARLLDHDRVWDELEARAQAGDLQGEELQLWEQLRSIDALLCDTEIPHDLTVGEEL